MDEFKLLLKLHNWTQVDLHKFESPFFFNSNKFTAKVSILNVEIRTGSYKTPERYSNLVMEIDNIDILSEFLTLLEKNK